MVKTFFTAAKVTHYSPITLNVAGKVSLIAE